MKYSLIFLCSVSFFSLILYLIWYLKGRGQRPWKLQVTAIYLSSTLFPPYLLYHLTGGGLYPDAIFIVFCVLMVMAASFGFFIPIVSNRFLNKEAYNDLT